MKDMILLLTFLSELFFIDNLTPNLEIFRGIFKNQFAKGENVYKILLLALVIVVVVFVLINDPLKKY